MRRWPRRWGATGLLVFDIAKRGLQQWVADRFREKGVHAEPDACAALLHLVGDDVSALAREIEKIATWADGEPVGEREVEELVAATADTPVFRVTDAWGRRDLTGLLEATEAMLERSGRPVSAIGSDRRRGSRPPGGDGDDARSVPRSVVRGRRK